MDAGGYRLGVDFGTSNTVAMLAWPDGQVRPLLFDGSPTLPSAVYADPGTGLMVGRDATHASRVSPERFEPNPKRRIDEPGVLLGEVEIGIVDLIAAVLGRVAGEARRVAGGHIGPATVTCPAAWAQTRRGILVAAAERAGLGAVSLVPEPVAAASVFVRLSERNVLPGSAFVVYDLGAGTFDATVVRRTGSGFDVLSTEGLSQSGGLDIDAAIVGYLGAVYSARDPNLWARLLRPTASAERRANRLLWEDVRAAKEMLSRASTTMIHIPLADEDAPLGRDQFEQLARPILDNTVTATRAAIASAQLTPAGIAGIFLVGGGSRIPLVATLLHQALGVSPTVVEQPELVVAQGSLGAMDALGSASAAPSGPAAYGPATTSYGPATTSYGPAATSYGPATSYGSASVPGSPVSAMPGGPVSGVPGSPVSGLPGGPVSGPPSRPVSPGGPGGRPPAGVYGSASLPPVDQTSAPPYGQVSGPPAGQTSTPPYGQTSTPAYGQMSSPPAVPMSPPAAWGGAAASGPGGPYPGAGPPPGAGQPPGGAYPAGARPAAKRNPGVLVAIALVVVLVLGGGGYALSKVLGDDDNSGGGGDKDNSAEVAADLTHADTDWTSSAESYESQVGKKIAFKCPADGTIGTVWGSDPYTTDSSVCTAAVHAARITLADGGRVVIEIRQGANSYEGSEQNGIVTTEYSSYPWSFTFVP